MRVEELSVFSPCKKIDETEFRMSAIVPASGTMHSPRKPGKGNDAFSHSPLHLTATGRWCLLWRSPFPGFSENTSEGFASQLTPDPIELSKFSITYKEQ